MRWRACVLAAVLAGAAAAEKPAVDLRPRWEAGEVYVYAYAMKLELKGRADLGGRKMPVRIVATNRHEYTDEVLRVSDGARRLRVRRRYRYAHTSKEGRIGPNEIPAATDAEPVEGKTVLLTRASPAAPVRCSLADAGRVEIDDAFQGFVAKESVRVGESWSQEPGAAVPSLKKAKLTCKLLRLTDLDGTPVAKVKVTLAAEGDFAGTPAKVTLRGYAYVETERGRVLKLDVDGPIAVVQERLGKLRGTLSITSRLRPLPGERAAPDEADPAPAEPEAPVDGAAPAGGRVLLQGLWRAKDRSTVDLKVVRLIGLEMGAQDTRLRARTVVRYDEVAVRASRGSWPARVTRTFTRHGHAISSATLGVDTKLRPHPLQGRRITFTAEGRLGLRAAGELPTTSDDLFGPVVGVDWECYLPQRAVRVGESWVVEQDLRRMLRLFGGHAAVRGELLSVADGLATIRLHTPEDLERRRWLPWATMTFSLARGQVVRCRARFVAEEDEEISHVIEVESVRTFDS